MLDNYSSVHNLCESVIFTNSREGEGSELSIITYDTKHRHILVWRGSLIYTEWTVIVLYYLCKHNISKFGTV